MAERLRWVFLAYRLPREPSTPRTAAWRTLRRLGAAQLADGVAALPLDARTKEHFEWLADEVVDAGGEASVWLAEAGSRAQERELARRMAEGVATEYQAVLDDAAELREAGRVDGRTLARLRRELRAIRDRDFFPPPQAEAARRAVEELAAEADRERAQ